MPKLLPDTCSRFERQLDAAADSRYTAIDTTLPSTAWHGEKLPDALLPSLAWALSVENWLPTASNADKRRAIANAWRNHRHKGTIGGLIDALDAAGINVQIEEWFGKITKGKQLRSVGKSQPVTMTIMVSNWAAGAPTDKIKAIIDANKRASVHYTLLTQAAAACKPFVTAAAQAVTTISVRQTGVAFRAVYQPLRAVGGAIGEDDRLIQGGAI